MLHQNDIIFELYKEIDDQNPDKIENILSRLSKTDKKKILSTKFSYLSQFGKKKYMEKPPMYPLTPIQFAATTTADDTFKVLMVHGANPYTIVENITGDYTGYGNDNNMYIGLNSFEIIKHIDMTVYNNYFKKMEI